MSNDEREIDRLEAQFPAVADSAFAAARRRALAAGLSVLEVAHGVSFDVLPDGHAVPVNEIEPNWHVPPGNALLIFERLGTLRQVLRFYSIAPSSD